MPTVGLDHLIPIAQSRIWLPYMRLRSTYVAGGACSPLNHIASWHPSIVLR